MMTNFVTINSDVIYPTTFTTIDVETATREGSICQIGMTIVKDGKVDKVISRLVRPYMNKYDAFYTGIHGINALMTRDCPDFLNVWGELAPMIEGPLVAHNARTFDYPVIRKNVELYDMDYELPEFMDTLDIYPAKLDVILDFLKVDKSMHHNAEFDSRICAELMLAANGLGSFADGIDPAEMELAAQDFNNAQRYLDGRIMLGDQYIFGNKSSEFVEYRKLSAIIIIALPARRVLTANGPILENLAEHVVNVYAVQQADHQFVAKTTDGQAYVLCDLPGTNAFQSYEKYWEKELLPVLERIYEKNPECEFWPSIR